MIIPLPRRFSLRKLLTCLLLMLGVSLVIIVNYIHPIVEVMTSLKEFIELELQPLPKMGGREISAQDWRKLSRKVWRLNQEPHAHGLTWFEPPACPKGSQGPAVVDWRKLPKLEELGHKKDPIEELFDFGLVGNSNSKLWYKESEFINKSVVPNIHHFVWCGPNLFMEYYHYLAILSAYKINRPDCLYLWVDTREGGEPSGKFWEIVKREIPNLVLVRRECPSAIFGHVVKQHEHRSDIVRLEVLLRYGGMYSDFDSVILKNMSELRVHDVTMGYENYADRSLANGMMLAKPNAPFLRLWYEGYRLFNDNQWSQMSCNLPGKLARNFPNLIHVAGYSLIKPFWFEQEWLYEKGKIFDWSKNYAMHLHKVQIRGYNETVMRTLDNTLARIYRLVVFGDTNARP